MNTKLTVVACMLFLLTVVAVFSEGPQWWKDRDVISTEMVSTNDYAPVNLGQLKNISFNAYEECIARGLPENEEYYHLLSVIYPWLNEGTPVNYEAANVGQLKNIASLFHSWLASSGYTRAMSFSVSGNEYAVANIGQVKNVFSFDPSETAYNDSGIIGGLLDSSESIRVDGTYETDIAYWKIFDAIPEQVYYGDEGDVVLEYKIPSLRNGNQVYPEKTWWRQSRNKRSPEEGYFLSSMNNGSKGWKSQGLKVVEYGGLYGEYHQYASHHAISDKGACSLRCVDYYAPEDMYSRIQLVYTGGGIIELDAPVYLLQWAPRVILEEASSK
ncbi:hypothetical protein BVX94_02625 [bacterium B17]|nr:hypothetical protein BVX94_02625 [bacterium B17]